MIREGFQQRDAVFPNSDACLKAPRADAPAGTITEGNTEYIVKTKSITGNLSELGNIYLKASDGKSFKLKDIAGIAIAPKKQYSFFLHSSAEQTANASKSSESFSEGVLIEIRRQPGYSPKAGR